MTKFSEITAVILAGGLGTRLRSVVADRPKVLAEVCGRPFLTYLLDQLAADGIRNAVLCTGYLGEQIRAALGDTYGHLRLMYSQETTPLGTGGALKLALPLIKSESALVMNGDSFCQITLKDFCAFHCARGARATLLLAEVSDTRSFGRVRLDQDGRITQFMEKGAEAGVGWVNAGVYLLGRGLLLTVPPRGAVSLEKEMFPIWKGRGLYGYRSHGHLLDMGTPEGYREASQFFALEKSP